MNVPLKRNPFLRNCVVYYPNSFLFFSILFKETQDLFVEFDKWIQFCQTVYQKVIFLKAFWKIVCTHQNQFCVIMAVKHFETILYEKLEPFFRNYDFVLLAEKKQFRKNTPTGFQNVIFTATAYQDEIWLEVNIGCRSHQVEQIAQQFLGNTRDYWADSNTLVISIGKFNDAKYFRYKIFNENDLEDTCEAIKEFLENTGFPFLNKSDNLKAINNIFNLQPSSPCKYLYNQTHRSYKGIITARLTNDERFLDLSNTHRNVLRRNGANPDELLTFERILSFLLYQSVN